MTPSVDTAEGEYTNTRKKIETFDHILPYIGGAGRYQWFLFFLLLPFASSYAFLYFTQFFLTLTPEEHWCTVPELNGWNLTDDQKISLSIPIADEFELSGDKNRRYSRCQMYDMNYTHLLNYGVMEADLSWPKTSCRHGWTFNYSNIPYVSIAGELEWVCDKAYYSSVAQSIFFIGSIIGGFIFGYIADRYGRLPALVTCNGVGFFASIGTIFCDSFWTFCVCRFIVGTAFDNCFNILFIIDKSSARVALEMGRITEITSVMTMRRWYISSGNIPKAIEMLKIFEKVNGKTIEEEIYEEFEQSCNEIIKNDNSHSNYTVLDLFKKPRLAYITVMLVLYWLLIIIVYDGHVWNMKALDPNVFTSFSLGALTELPAAILLTLFLDKWGRRWMGFISMMICGVFSFITLGMPPGSATITTGVLARFGVNIAGNIGFQYAAEMLPTVVRAQGVSLIHIIGYVAHIIGPYIVYLSDVSAALPLIVLGLLSVIVAVQALFMPETLGQGLPQTLQEGNDFGREQSFWWVPCVSSTFEKKKQFRQPSIPNSL